MLQYSAEYEKINEPALLSDAAAALVAVATRLEQLSSVQNLNYPNNLNYCHLFRIPFTSEAASH